MKNKRYTVTEEIYILYYEMSKPTYQRICKERFNLRENLHFAYVTVAQNALIIYPGFKSDGCTPSFKIAGRWFGTPDGKVDPETGKPKLYFAFLAHDALYNKLEMIPFSRKTADMIFLDLMRVENFKAAKLYYCAVRLLGGVYHWFRKKFGR